MCLIECRQQRFRAASSLSHLWDVDGELQPNFPTKRNAWHFCRVRHHVNCFNKVVPNDGRENYQKNKLPAMSYRNCARTSA